MLSPILIQGIGFVSAALIVFSFLSNKRRTILFLFILSLSLFSLHLFLLGALTGAIVSFIGAIRTCIFSQKKKAMRNFWLYLFIIIFIIAGIISWQNYYSILPIVGMILGTIALWQKKTKNIRLILILATFSWLIYVLIVKSYSGIIIESLTLISIIIGIIRYDILKSKSRIGISIRAREIYKKMFNEVNQH